MFNPNVVSAKDSIANSAEMLLELRPELPYISKDISTQNESGAVIMLSNISLGSQSALKLERSSKLDEIDQYTTRIKQENKMQRF